jgi:hypothetical protein
MQVVSIRRLDVCRVRDVIEREGAAIALPLQRALDVSGLIAAGESAGRTQRF